MNNVIDYHGNVISITYIDLASEKKVVYIYPDSKP